MYASIQIPKPTDEHVLERAPIELFRKLLNDPNTNTYGRRGQAQQGVDIVGKRDGNPEKFVGIQCKLKGHDKELTEEIVREEVTKALSFCPLLAEYFIISTAPDDAKLQKLARELELEIKSEHDRLISIQVWGWDSVQREIQRFPEAIKAFCPDYTWHSDGIKDGISQISAGQAALHDKLDSYMQVTQAGATVPLGALGETTPPDPLEKHIDQEIDSYREIANSGRPLDAIEMFKNLEDRLEKNVGGRLRFRIKANVASCMFALGEGDAASKLLVEACALAPEEPKAKANLAMAYLMQGNWRQARSVCEEGLSIDETNEDLAGYLVQALRQDPKASNPLSLVPECVRSSKPVQIAYLFYQRQRELTPDWWKFAKNLRNQYPDENYVRQAAAEAIIDEVLTEEGISNKYNVPQHRISELQTAQADLLHLWKQHQASQAVVQSEELGLFANLILSCDLLTDIDNFTTLVNDAHDDVLADEAVAIRVAQMAFNIGDNEIFKGAIGRLSSEKPKFHFSFYHALQERDWNTIKGLAGQVTILAEPHEIEMFALAVKVAQLVTFEGAVSAQQILDLAEGIESDFRCYLLLLSALNKKGYVDEAHDLYLAAVQKISASNEHASKIMLANYAYKERDWATIVQSLGSLVNTERDNDELRLLATAYVNLIPASKSAVRFFEGLPPDLKKLPYFLEREAVFHFNRGALAQSERCFRDAIKHSEDPDLGLYLPLLSLLVRSRKENEINALSEEMSKLDLSGSGEEQATYAHFLMSQGYPEKAMVVAYSSLAEAPESPEVHNGLCTLILMNTRHGPNERVVPSVSVVENDCWVKLERADGECVELLVCDDPENEPKHLFPRAVRASDNPIANQCLGHAVGFEFEIKDAFGIDTVNWKITNIEHKYGQACRKIMDGFSVLFPDSRLMGQMRMAEGDVQPILEYVRQRAEYHQNIADYYIENGFPLAFIAAMQSSSAIQFGHYLRSLGAQIIACRGLDTERSEAFSLIDRRRIDGVVLDAYTAWTVATLGAFEALKKVFGTLYIPQTCLDETTRMLVELENEPGERFGLSWKNGEFWKEEHSEIDVRRQEQFLNDVHSDISSYCQILPSAAPDDLSEASRELLQNISQSVFDAAFIASDGKLLLSEDLHYRNIAKHELNVDGMWLQSVFMYASANNFLDFKEYCRLVIGLAYRGHAHLSVNAGVLAEVAKNSDFEFDDFEAVADFLGTRDADIVSHYHVASDCIALIWRSSKLSKHNKQKYCSTILRKLLRYRSDDWATTLALIYVAASKSLRIFVFKWTRGHFLPISEFSEAVTNVLQIQFPGE